MRLNARSVRRPSDLSRLLQPVFTATNAFRVQPSLAFGRSTTLALLVVVRILTDSLPEVAFSKVKVATLLWRSCLRQRQPGTARDTGE